MKRYDIYNKATKEYRNQIQAESVHEACAEQGWYTNDCDVVELTASKNSQPPFKLTEEEKHNIQRAIDRGLDDLNGFNLNELRDTLRRWMEAQNWES